MVDPLNMAGKSILLCEPEGITLLMLRQTFQRLGMRVIAQVQTGRDVIATALRHHPDCVIIDLDLSDMNGIEAARQILATIPLCIIVLSSQTDEATRQRAQEAGVQGFIAKPFQAKDLARYFEDACDTDPS
jgi:CheY-like chemotaxis protein